MGPGQSCTAASNPGDDGDDCGDDCGDNFGGGDRASGVAGIGGDIGVGMFGAVVFSVARWRAMSFFAIAPTLSP